MQFSEALKSFISLEYKALQAIINFCKIANLDKTC
jgi:hypothetical protein